MPRAGGVEALCELLDHLGHPGDVVVVVVLHLDPTHEGRLVDVLARHTDLPVREVVDRLRLEPGHVFVIPPDRDLEVEGDEFRLTPPRVPRGRRLPIDHLFRSMAAVVGPSAVGVVLSGMGSDGTDGLRSIREAGGVTLVQSPETARFDSMPRAAIDAGVVDVVAPIAGLVDELRRRALGGSHRIGGAPTFRGGGDGDAARADDLDDGRVEPASLERRRGRRRGTPGCGPNPACDHGPPSARNPQG